MKKIRPYLIGFALLAGLICIKVKFFSPDISPQLNGKNGKKAGTPVSVYVVGNEGIEDKLFANGTVLANEETELKVETSGRIVFLNLPEGKFVKEGTLLIKLNDSEIRAQLEKVNAKLRVTSETEKRLKKIFMINGISKQEYEMALSDLETLRADSLYFQTQIAKTELKAPFNGTIGVRSISIGSYVTPSSVLASLHQINPVKIEFTLPEKYSDLFKEGDKIHFVKEGVGEKLTALIQVRDPSIDLNSRSIRFRAIADNSKGLLFPGGFVRVELLISTSKDNLFVPTESIIPFAKGKKVFIVKNNSALEKVVETGIRTEDHVQLLSGLEVGDSVVVNGNFQLREGAAVRITTGNRKN